MLHCSSGAQPQCSFKHQPRAPAAITSRRHWPQEHPSLSGYTSRSIRLPLTRSGSPYPHFHTPSTLPSRPERVTDNVRRFQPQENRHSNVEKPPTEHVPAAIAAASWPAPHRFQVQQLIRRSIPGTREQAKPVATTAATNLPVSRDQSCLGQSQGLNQLTTPAALSPDRS